MAQTFAVEGMTCENCARHVRDALLELGGVRDARVDLDAASAEVDADRRLAPAEVAAALEEAGYRLRA